MSIGDDVGMNSNVVIACHDSISIGSRVEIGPNVCIYDHEHDFRDPRGLSAGTYRTASVTVGDDVWIGANVVILKGVEIGDRCVIGAGCIVSEPVPDDHIIVQKRESSIRKIVHG